MTDRLAAVGDPELRSALLFVRAGARPVTVDELAAHQRVHRNVARARLERLVAAGLLQSGFERRSGRAGPGAGRPAKTYCTAPELEAVEFPPHRYELLLGLLADALPAAERSRRLTEVGVAFGRELARTSGIAPARGTSEGLERACAGLRSLGFNAVVERVDADAAVIVTPTCPLRPLVSAEADAAEIDRGMWTGLVAEALGVEADTVSCRAEGCTVPDAPCRVCVQLASGELTGENPGP
jgi:predicted ArsR family transcriptional regulator